MAKSRASAAPVVRPRDLVHALSIQYPGLTDEQAQVVAHEVQERVITGIAEGRQVALFRNVDGDDVEISVLALREIVDEVLRRPKG